MSTPLLHPCKRPTASRWPYGTQGRPRPQHADALRPRRQPQRLLRPHEKQRHAADVRASAAAAYDGGEDPAAAKAWQPSFLDPTYDKEILALAVPALASMLLDPILSAINTGLVGHLGTQALAAVSIGSMVVSFCTMIFSFMLVLTTPRIAAAVATNDTNRVATIASASLWISTVCGIAVMLLMFTGADGIMAVLRPPEAAVAEQAATYIRMRALGLVPALCIMTCAGIFRGFKDTRTPLVASALTATTSLILNVLLIYGLNLGVLGAALATSSAQWVSFVALLALLLRSGRVRLPDLLQMPSLRDLLPILRAGFMLSGRTVVSFGLVMYASTLCVRAGATMQGAFEVVRQLFMLTFQFWECLNVSSQALAAAYLGAKDYSRARGVLSRITFLGVLIAIGSALLVWMNLDGLVTLFTKDATVIREVLLTMPLICAMFPMDAAASIMDGGLFASQQTDFLAVVQLAGAVVQYAVLLWVVANGQVSSVAIWGTLKLSSVLRVSCGMFRNFFSPKSGFRPAPAAAAA